MKDEDDYHLALGMENMADRLYRAEQASSGNSELLACPFCGCAVHWCDCGMSDDGHDGCHQITCPRCGNFDFANGHLDGDRETMEELRECMAAKWNTRAG